MSTPHPSLPAEAHIGQALAILQRLKPRLEETPCSNEVQTALQGTIEVLDRILPLVGDSAQLGDVQAALRKAAAHIESAQAAFEQERAEQPDAPVNGEVLAVIAAAGATVLDRPCRIVDVQRKAPVVSWINAWALEGRLQQYSSRRIR